MSELKEFDPFRMSSAEVDPLTDFFAREKEQLAQLEDVAFGNRSRLPLPVGGGSLLFVPF